MKWLVLISACAAAGPGWTLDVPSGQPLTFHEMIWDEPLGGLAYRFRFVAPELGQPGRGFDDVVEDFQYLCDTFAVPRISTIGPQPSDIVISLSSEPTEFGEIEPGVTQFFEAFSYQDGLCIWEYF